MARRQLLSGLMAAAMAMACEIPEEPPLSNTITEGFGLVVQNPEFPVIHNRFYNLFEAGGGDQHLFLSPTGEYAFDLTLVNGVITWGPTPLRAVIQGEYLITDNTTKLFMTERGDPRAVFQPTYGCNPDTDELQVELSFVLNQDSEVPGGNICVRSAAGDTHEFRWSPPENPAYDPARPCFPVTLVIDRSGPPPAPSGLPSATSTAVPVPTVTVTPEIFADMTAEGFAFVGCAPEEGPAGDGLGRTLDGALFATDLLTNEACVAHCGGLGFTFAGSEYSRECWCGNSYPPTREPGTTIASLSGCNMRCGGDRGQYCGGAGWMSLYVACEAGQPCENAEFS